MNRDLIAKNYFRVVFAVLLLAFGFALMADREKSHNTQRHNPGERVGFTIHLENDAG